MSGLLLGGRLLPTTGVVGFVEGPVDEVVDAFAEVVAARWDGGELRRTAVGGPLEEALGHLQPPADGPAGAFLLCPTAGDWSAFFDDGATGGDPGPMAVHLPDRLGCRSLVVMAVPGPDGRPLQTAAFSLAAPGRASWADAVRTVTVSRHGGEVEVDAGGDPLPAEGDDDPADLDLERLDRYLASLGVHAFDASWYFPAGSRGVLLRR